MKHVLVRDWQPVGGGIEARCIGTGDQRVDPTGRLIDGPWPLPPDVQATQRFVHGALVETRHDATDIYVVITYDRHSGTDAVPFASEDAAVAHAESAVAGAQPYPEDIDREMNDGMKADGWVWYCRYSCEGDSVRVVRRELRG